MTLLALLSLGLALPAGIGAMLSSYLLMPRSKVKLSPASLSAPRRLPPEPEFDFDPLAFWLFPDWEGPIDEPFWMRPLRKPKRNVSHETLPLPMMHGKTHIGGMLMWYGDENARRLVRKPSVLAAPGDELLINNRLHTVRKAGEHRVHSIMRIGADTIIEIVEPDGEHVFIEGGNLPPP